MPFPAAQVKKNQNNLDYVSIDGYINRLLDVLGLGYDFTVTQSSIELLPEEMSTSTGKRQFLAQVTAQLTISNSSNVEATTRAGVGADVSFDADKALKTAQAEALKKACHQFGIALELWDEEHRADLERERKMSNQTDAQLKRRVMALGKERTGLEKPTAAQIAEVFGCNTSDLADRAMLERILKDAS